MHQFALERYAYEQDGDWPDTRETVDLVVPVVDGVPLFEIVDAGYPGVAIEYVAPPSHHWLGQPVYEEDGRAVVIDGSCGVAGCCGVLADIIVSGDTVTWTGVFSLGDETFAFLFDRAQYERAIADVRDLPSRPMCAPDDVLTTEPVSGVEGQLVAEPAPAPDGDSSDRITTATAWVDLTDVRRKQQRANRKRKKKDRDPRFVVGKTSLRRYVKDLVAATADGPVRFTAEHNGFRLTSLDADGDFSTVIPWIDLVSAKPTRWPDVVGDAEMALVNRRYGLTHGEPDVVRDAFVIMAPLEGPPEPIELQVSKAGPPGQVVVSSAVAVWPGAVSLSWQRDRLTDWSRVLTAANELAAPAFDGVGPSTDIEAVNVPGLRWPYIIGTKLPHLGVTAFEMHGLRHATALIVAGRADTPKHVRLHAVEDGETLDAFGDPTPRLRPLY